jgi:ABC-type transporter Mla MlaB component
MKQRKQAGKTRRTPPRPAPAARKRVARKVVTANDRLVLSAECVIASVETLKSDLLSLLASPSTVKLDASAVRRIDTASLQVLAAFAWGRRAEGRPFQWTGAHGALAEAARLANLTATLELAPMGVQDGTDVTGAAVMA